ncbi:MAG TPA: peptidoglycan recognition family protein [Jatrophihabitantaceae bacterium]|jgi:hypothetical protein|nr:peptidoglycan recognition family protein [Jatrophihabitantaceae bacterium]
MPVYADAIFKPISGHTNGPMQSYTGVVLHVNDAQSLDLHDFFDDPKREVSSHWQVTKDGTIFQYIDTDNTSWCQGDGNDDYLSIESQGLADESATDAQIDAIGGILAWCQETHGIPLQLAEKPGDAGFGWHGMGAAHGHRGWGHPACPGVRRDQRSAMLTAARRRATGVSTMVEDWFDMATKDDLQGVVRDELRNIGTAPITADDTKITMRLGDRIIDMERKVNDLQSKVGSTVQTLNAMRSTLDAIKKKVGA